MVLEDLTRVAGRGNLTCHPWEPFHGSSVTLFLVPFLPLGMEISVSCLFHYHGVGADNLFYRLLSGKNFFLF